MADEFSMTTWTDSRTWVSNATQFQQQTEALDLRFRYGTDTYKSAIRFLANGDLRLFGELVTETGAFRSYDTFAFTAESTSDDIASFRTGGNAGTERLRIASEGRIVAGLDTDDDPLNLELEGVEVEFHASSAGTSARWGALKFESGVRQLTAGTSNAPAGVTRLNLAAKDLDFRLYHSAGGGSFKSWAELSFTSGERLLDCTQNATDPLRVRAEEIGLDASRSGTITEWGVLSFDSGTGDRVLDCTGTTDPLHLRADKLEIELDKLGSIGEWGTLSRTLIGSYVAIPDNVLLRAKSGSNFKNVVIDCEKFFVIVHGQDCVKFQDDNEDTRFKFTMSGQATVTGQANQNVDLTLDATATTNAKKWTIRATKDGTPTGSLKFINETDTGTPTVEFEPDGSVYSPKFIGGLTTAGAPADAAGRGGAWVVDTTNKRIWVKVKATGTDRWWYAALVSP